jgi:hypothetical protein
MADGATQQMVEALKAGVQQEFFPIPCFYAVTATSVYRVELVGKDAPKLVKIACRGESGVAVGTELSNGTMVAVCRHVQLYFPEGGGGANSTYERRIENVNTAYWGAGTTDIVALFLREKDAMRCNEALDLVKLDPRYKHQTIETLRAIGNDHPKCSISCWEGLWIMPPQEWQEAKKP